MRNICTARWKDPAFRGCIRKKKFISILDAERIRQRVMAQNFQPCVLQVYPCPYCDGFHLTKTMAVVDK